MSSQYGRVRVPSASNARDIDNYLDEIFGPVLRNAAYADEDEPVAVPDAKTLAASIKGGGSKSTKARTDMVCSIFRHGFFMVLLLEMFVGGFFRLSLNERMLGLSKIS